MQKKILCFGENRAWKFVKYTWTWVIPGWTEISNGRNKFYSQEQVKSVEQNTSIYGFIAKKTEFERV